MKMKCFTCGGNCDPASQKPSSVRDERMKMMAKNLKFFCTAMYEDMMAAEDRSFVCDKCEKALEQCAKFKAVALESIQLSTATWFSNENNKIVLNQIFSHDERETIKQEISSDETVNDENDPNLSNVSDANSFSRFGMADIFCANDVKVTKIRCIYIQKEEEAEWRPKKKRTKMLRAQTPDLLKSLPHWPSRWNICGICNDEFVDVVLMQQHVLKHKKRNLRAPFNLLV